MNSTMSIACIINIFMRTPTIYKKTHPLPQSTKTHIFHLNRLVYSLLVLYDEMRLFPHISNRNADK